MNDRSSSSSSRSRSRLGIQKTKQKKRTNNDSDNNKATSNTNHGRLHPHVTMPPSLRRSHLLGRDILDQLQPLSPDLQNAVLQSYAHTIQSEAGMKKVVHNNNKGDEEEEEDDPGDVLRRARARRHTLFQRAMEK
eukprot:scaffold15573_cov69-Attheya_sp.AAC.2